MAPSSLPVSGPGYRSTSWSVHNGLLDMESQSVAGTSDSDMKLESEDEVKSNFCRTLEDQLTRACVHPLGFVWPFMLQQR